MREPIGVFAVVLVSESIIYLTLFRALGQIPYKLALVNPPLIVDQAQYEIATANSEKYWISNPHIGASLPVAPDQLWSVSRANV